MWCIYMSHVTWCLFPDIYQNLNARSLRKQEDHYTHVVKIRSDFTKKRLDYPNPMYLHIFIPHPLIILTSSTFLKLESSFSRRKEYNPFSSILSFLHFKSLLPWKPSDLWQEVTVTFFTFLFQSGVSSETARIGRSLNFLNSYLFSQKLVT